MHCALRTHHSNMTMLYATIQQMENTHFLETIRRYADDQATQQYATSPSPAIY